MSKFRIWVDDSNLDKVMGFDQFDTDTQRQAGFTGGTPASSIRVNTALRQANLVACALMNIVDTGNTADFRSPVATVQSLLSNYISNSMVAYKATNADVNNLNSENNAVVNFKIGNGTAYNKTINNVANVTTSINNQLITNIFETNGTTVKQSTNTQKVQNVNLSDNTVPTFGNYIIEKKLSVFQGSSLITDSNSTTINLTNSVSGGDILELRFYAGGFNSSYFSKMICPGISSGSSSMLIGIDDSNMVSLSISFPTSTSIKFNAGGASDYTNFHISRIYKIIGG